MRKLLLFLPFILLLLFPARSFSQVSSVLSDTLQKTLNAKAKALGLQSAVAAVVLPDGTYWEGAYGMLGTDSAKPHMLYEIGSNTKAFTSSIILQLANEGKLKLDDSIYKYVRHYPNVANGITIRQLLNHTSGIYNYTDNPNASSIILADINHFFTPDTILNNFLAPMLFPPGTSWAYSSSNYLLLGLIIEKVEGRPYHVSLRERLLKPFGFPEMNLDPQEPYSLPKAGTWLNIGIYFNQHIISLMSAAWAAGAIVATPVDLAKWGRMLYGGKVLPGHWLDSMETGVPLTNGEKYGLGVFQRTLDGKTYFGHPGTTIQNSELDYSVASDFSVATVVNVQDKYAEARSIQNALILLVDKYVNNKLAVRTVSTPQQQFSVYPNPTTGQITVPIPNYITTPVTINVYNLNGALVHQQTSQGNSSNMNIENYPSGMYFIRVINPQGKMIYSDKLLKQ